jgi:hypothetical protein
MEYRKKAFIFDKENEKIVEFDFIKNAASLTAIIADKKDIQELNRYKIELQKLKNFLYDKIDQHPQIAKEISNDMNIVSREIDSVNNISGDEKQMAKSGNSKIELNVNDKDLYEDANQMIEDEEQQQEEKRKFKR